MKSLFSRIALILCILSFTSFFTTAILADDAPIKIETALTDKVLGDDAVDEKDTFSKDTEMIYLVCKTDALKKGQSLKAKWIADDTKNVAPPHYQIEEKEMTMGKDLGSSDEWKVNFSLSKPTAGWPLGQYHVDLYVDNKLVKAVKFTIGADSASSANKIDTTDKTDDTESTDTTN